MNLSVFSFHSVRTRVNYYCPQQNLILSPPNLSNESTSGAEEQIEGAPLMAVVCLTVNHRSSPLSTMTKIAATCHPVSVSTCCCHLYVIGEVKTDAELSTCIIHVMQRERCWSARTAGNIRGDIGKHVTVVPTRSPQSQSKPRK